MIDIQNASTLTSLPADELLIKWAKQALDEQYLNAEITLRIVDTEEGRNLNKKWRKKDSATNVLSFPINEKIEQVPNLLGDVVICAPLVEREAVAQGKRLEAHWAHLIIHGVLHLQDYDHVSEAQANVMEAKEIQILKKMGYANPYHKSCNHA